MKFLAKLDPMTALLLVVIFGVVITMSTQASPRRPAQLSMEDATLQTAPVKALSLDTQAVRSGKT